MQGLEYGDLSSQFLELYECSPQEWEPPVQHDHQETGRWVEGGLGEVEGVKVEEEVKEEEEVEKEEIKCMSEEI